MSRKTGWQRTCEAKVKTDALILQLTIERDIAESELAQLKRDAINAQDQFVPIALGQLSASENLVRSLKDRVIRSEAAERRDHIFIAVLAFAWMAALIWIIWK